MTLTATECVLLSTREHYTLEDYEGKVPRWCTGCGDNAILASLQRLCRDEQLPREKVVFVSGIGCSGRFPHYMNTYGFHGLHGRALPVAERIKIRRPDLHVFVNTGDGDCCSIGAAHWIHAIRYNMDMTVILHDNRTYGLTKHQTSPTAPRGLTSNTTPYGAYLNPLDPLSVALGVTNASFIAQAVDWIPEVLHQIVELAFRHKGFSFIRVLQRCPEYLPAFFDPWVQDPGRVRLLTHQDGIEPSASLSRTYRNQQNHDPGDLLGAKDIAASADGIPVGILYRNPEIPRYEELRKPDRAYPPEEIRKSFEEELDRFTIWPQKEGEHASQ